MLTLGFTSLYICWDVLISGEVELFWIPIYFSIFPSWYVKLVLSMYLSLIFWTWNWQEESDSERESNDAPGSRKPVKRKREKVQLSVSKDPVQSQSVTSGDGCLSLLKKRRIDGKIHVIVLLLRFFLIRELIFCFVFYLCILSAQFTAVM
jgi:hypothetical protein